ncbi:hypothetical protein GCD22_03611 [Acidithiobacillus thiooxidans ATCC 19377]|uniref:Uncharacterized protein n=1 Tax=Acidithiobacillus thiooxidans ATCC 19377 TaxID=637390 RepID=A0A5P9XVN8_ACITH|nr:hypothetical protein GCD22_03611 [Acidithiobacillus thiooxidans ATCC 19377]
MSLGTVNKKSASLNMTFTKMKENFKMEKYVSTFLLSAAARNRCFLDSEVR